MRNAYKILVRKFEGKIFLGRPRRRREEHIEANLEDVAYSNADSIQLPQDRA
jgi:hypothetical protein